jgi:glucose-6-phosphate isomerase
MDQHETRIVRAAGLCLEFTRHDPAALSAASVALRESPHAVRELLGANLLNSSEGRAAWHLLAREGAEGIDEESSAATRFLHNEQREAQAWAEAVLRGPGPVPDIIHLGTGGCDTPLRAVHTALSAVQAPRCRIHWVANLDGATLQQVLDRCDPATTWVLVNSKSMRTREVLRNAEVVLEWLARHWGHDVASSRVVALTAAPQLAREILRVPASQVFCSLPEIGGRFSLWSVHGLALTLAFGGATVSRLHAGARAMDRHMLDTPLEHSTAGTLAGLSFIYRSTQAIDLLSIALYGDAFEHVPSYLQQLLMESLGKSVDVDGNPRRGIGGPAVLAGVGTCAQHGYFQLLHQGDHASMHEIVAVARPWHRHVAHHTGLLANAIGQAEALWRGQPAKLNTRQPSLGSPMQAARRSRECACPGRRPSTLIWLERLDAEHLGALLALYEHRTVVEAWLHGINPFDQWGVELGKTLALDVERAIGGSGPNTALTPTIAASLRYLGSKLVYNPPIRSRVEST